MWYDYVKSASIQKINLLFCFGCLFLCCVVLFCFVFCYLIVNTICKHFGEILIEIGHLVPKIWVAEGSQMQKTIDTAAASLSLPGGQDKDFLNLSAFSYISSNFSSNFLQFLLHFGLLGGQLTHLGRPWLCHWQKKVLFPLLGCISIFPPSKWFGLISLHMLIWILNFRLSFWLLMYFIRKLKLQGVWLHLSSFSFFSKRKNVMWSSKMTWNLQILILRSSQL